MCGERGDALRKQALSAPTQATATTSCRVPSPWTAWAVSPSVGNHAGKGPSPVWAGQGLLGWVGWR